MYTSPGPPFFDLNCTSKSPVLSFRFLIFSPIDQIFEDFTLLRLFEKLEVFKAAYTFCLAELEMNVAHSISGIVSSLIQFSAD